MKKCKIYFRCSLEGDLLLFRCLALLSVCPFFVGHFEEEKTQRTWILSLFPTLYGNLFPLLGKLTDCWLGPTTRSSPAASFIHRLWKLKSCALPQSKLTSSEARESARCPRVPDCSQSCRMSRILRVYPCKKVAKSRNIFYGGKISSPFIQCDICQLWLWSDQLASCPPPSSSVLQQGVAIFIFI